MGFYINPVSKSKEDFLSDAIEAGKAEHIGRIAPTANKFGNRVAVCLVNNGMFTAAGICFSMDELHAFARHDGRSKEWFMVDIDHVAPWLHGQEVS